MEPAAVGSPEGESIVREKQSAAIRSVIAGATLTSIKLAAGIATHSLGLLAEAAHSALDLAAAVMTWFAVRTSWRPPDEEHPYGHGKIENLTALGEAALLVLTSVWILYEAARRVLGEGPEVEPSPWAFGVIGISIAVDIVRARDLKRVARRSGSQALEADALHFSTDIASSSVVMVGLVGVLLSRVGGYEWLRYADPVAASVVALIVLVLSWQLGRRAVDMLLDRAPSGLIRAVEDALAGVEGLEGAPRVRVRQSGERIFADVELPVRRVLPVAEGQRIAEAARTRVLEVFGPTADVMIQLQATEDQKETLRDRVATAVEMEGVHAHNITLRDGDGGAHVDLHLELPGNLSLGEGHVISDRVEARILAEVTGVRRVDIHLELHDEAPETIGSLDDPLREDLVSRIDAASRRVAGGGAVHDIMLARTSGGIYLSCHCFVPAETSLADAHLLTERLEKAFREAAPELARIAVHAEPFGSRRLTPRRAEAPGD